MKASRGLKRSGQFRFVGAARNLNYAKSFKVIGRKLRVQKLIPPSPQPCHQPHQSDLACVTDAAEHALAEKASAETDTVKAANPLIILPSFDAVSEAAPVQIDIGVYNRVIDPSL